MNRHNLESIGHDQTYKFYIIICFRRDHLKRIIGRKNLRAMRGIALVPTSSLAETLKERRSKAKMTVFQAPKRAMVEAICVCKKLKFVSVKVRDFNFLEYIYKLSTKLVVDGFNFKRDKNGIELLCRKLCIYFKDDQDMFFFFFCISTCSV